MMKMIQKLLPQEGICSQRTTITQNAQTYTEGRIDEKANAVKILTLEVPIVPPPLQTKCFWKALRKIYLPQDLDRAWFTKVDWLHGRRKAIAHTLRDLAKKILGEKSGSPFTQRIADAPLYKKFYLLKFNVYNSWTDPTNQIKYYQQVMA